MVVNTTFITISLTVSGSVSDFTQDRTQNVTDALRALLCPEDNCPGVTIEITILPDSGEIKVTISYREDDESVAAPVEAGSGEAGSGAVTLADTILLRAEQIANATTANDTTAAALQLLSQSLGATVELQVGSVIVQKHVPVEVPLPLSPPPPSPAPPMPPAASPLLPETDSNIELLAPGKGHWQDETAATVFFVGGMLLVLLLGCFLFSRRCLALPCLVSPLCRTSLPPRPAHSQPVCASRPQ